MNNLVSLIGRRDIHSCIECASNLQVLICARSSVANIVDPTYQTTGPCIFFPPLSERLPTIILKRQACATRLRSQHQRSFIGENRQCASRVSLRRCQWLRSWGHSFRLTLYGLRALTDGAELLLLRRDQRLSGAGAPQLRLQPTVPISVPASSTQVRSCVVSFKAVNQQALQNIQNQKARNFSGRHRCRRNIASGRSLVQVCIYTTFGA